MRGRRVVVTLLAVVLVLAAATVAVSLSTGNRFSGHCRGGTHIGAAIDGFDAPATALDRTRLVATVAADRTAEVHLGQTVTAPDADPQPSRDGTVTGIAGRQVTVTYVRQPYATEQPTVLVPGAPGHVKIMTSYLSKTSLVPAVALRPVAGRPDLATLLSTTGTGPVEPHAVGDVHVIGPDATWGPVDPDTARRLGAVAEPFEDRSLVIAPDRACRTAGLWPPVLTEDRDLDQG